MDSKRSFFRAKGVPPSFGETTDRQVAHAIYRCLLDAMIVMDGGGLIVEYNSAAEMLFGFTREEAVGQELANLIIPEEMREAHQAGLKHFLATGEGPVIGQRIEIEGLHQSGERIPVELAIAETIVDGHSLFVATLKDLRARKKLELERAHVQRNLDLIMDYAPAVFFLLRRNGNDVPFLQWVSPNIRTILGMDAEALIADPADYDRAIHPDDLDRTTSTQRAIWDAGEGAMEYRLRRAGGGWYWVRDTQRVVIDPDSGVQEIVGTLEDITDDRMGRERERMLRRELDHRVKNNLQIILGVCDKAAASEVPDRDSIIRLNERIRSMALVHQLLADGGWLPIDLDELIRQGVAGLASEDSEARLVDLDGGKISIGVDAAMTLGSVFNELITNAAKHGGLKPGAGGVSVRWGVEGFGDEKVLRIQWRERLLGDELKHPKQDNFGMQLIKGMIPYELGGDVNLRFEAGGLQFDATIPLERCKADLGHHRLQTPK